MTTRTHVYLDLDVVNNNFRSEATAPVLRFEETRNSPYLDGDSADYYCSIIRFSIQTGNSLPVFIPRIETGQTNAKKTVYNVSMEFTFGGATGLQPMSYSVTVPISYQATDAAAPAPNIPIVSQDMTSTYY